MLRSLSYAQSIQSNIQSLYQSAPYIETLNEEIARYQASAQVHGGGRSIASARSRSTTCRSSTTRRSRAQGLELRRRAREIVGIVGPSGSGSRRWSSCSCVGEPTHGTVLSTDATPRHLRRRVGYQRVSSVPQDRTLRGDDRREIRSSATASTTPRSSAPRSSRTCHEDIMGGRGLRHFRRRAGFAPVGWQRQRLCIARALVESPDVMLSMSHELPRRAVGSLIRRRSPNSRSHTVFIIAHACRRSRSAIAHGRARRVLEGFDTPDRLEAEKSLLS